MMAVANLGSCNAILGRIPQVNPNYTQMPTAMHQSLGFNLPHMHYSFDYPNLQVSD